MRSDVELGSASYRQENCQLHGIVRLHARDPLVLGGHGMVRLHAHVVVEARSPRPPRLRGCSGRPCPPPGTRPHGPHPIESLKRGGNHKGSKIFKIIYEFNLSKGQVVRDVGIAGVGRLVDVAGVVVVVRVVVVAGVVVGGPG